MDGGCTLTGMLRQQRVGRSVLFLLGKMGVVLSALEALA